MINKLSVAQYNRLTNKVLDVYKKGAIDYDKWMDDASVVYLYNSDKLAVTEMQLMLLAKRVMEIDSEVK